MYVHILLSRSSEGLAIFDYAVEIVTGNLLVLRCIPILPAMKVARSGW